MVYRRKKNIFKVILQVFCPFKNHIIKASLTLHSLFDHTKLLFLSLTGSLHVTMYEKSCAIPSQCGVSGQKYASGLYFNYTNVCCDTDLCNGAGTVAALSWGRVALCLLPAIILLLA